MSTHANLRDVPVPNHNSVVVDECLSAWGDDLLVSAAKAGDRNAFVELYERHFRKVLPRIYRITRNWEDAEDAFQDAALRAFVHMKDFEGRSHFASWLTRIAINSSLMVLRKTRRVGETPIEQMCDDSGTPRTWEPPDHSETPEACYARRESEELLRNAIQHLPCILRDALELQHSREYSTSQVAEELGISVPAAKSRLLRARTTMRRRLSATRPPKPLSTRSASPSEGNSKTASDSSKTV